MIKLVISFVDSFIVIGIFEVVKKKRKKKTVNVVKTTNVSNAGAMRVRMRVHGIQVLFKYTLYSSNKLYQ